MKTETEYDEGPEAYTRFESAIKTVLAVSHTEIQKRVKEARERSLSNPKKRGPKAKRKA